MYLLYVFYQRQVEGGGCCSVTLRLQEESQPEGQDCHGGEVDLFLPPDL